MDEDEVQAYKWIDIPQLYSDVACEPDKYTSWLKAELDLLQDKLCSSQNQSSS